MMRMMQLTINDLMFFLAGTGVYFIKWTWYCTMVLHLIGPVAVPLVYLFLTRPNRRRERVGA